MRGRYTNNELFELSLKQWRGLRVGLFKRCFKIKYKISKELENEKDMSRQRFHGRLMKPCERPTWAEEGEKKVPAQNFRELPKLRSRREGPGIAERQLEKEAMTAQRDGVSGRGALVRSAEEGLKHVRGHLRP